MSKYKIEATIPTTQYGNLRPTIEINSPEEETEAIETIQRLWNRFGENKLKDNTGGGRRIDTFTGEVVFFNEETHTYTDEQGNVLESGSHYANEHSPKFDMDAVLPKTATSWGVNEADLKDVWRLNSEISNHWGSAIHTALELYHLYHGLGSKVQEKKELAENYVLPKNPFLSKLVQDFVSLYGDKAYPEVVVSDVANGMVGTIDRLEEVEGGYRVGDYKTNNEMDKKKTLKYQKQLSFYSHILLNKGFKVSGIDLYYYDMETGWSKEELDVLPLEV